MDKKIITKEMFITYFENTLGFDRRIALKKGVLSTDDMVNITSDATRTMCARIFHMILLVLLDEKDEEDWSAALDLRDLYDCHRCVGHIAQVYAKGIMSAKGEGFFGTKEGITISEMKESFQKLLDKSIRNKPQRRPVAFGSCSIDGLHNVIERNRKCIVVDVRDRETFVRDKIIDSSINIPLEELNKNPYCVAEDRSTPVYLVCSKGYQSAVAAELLIKYGYTNVYTVK